MTLYEYWSSVLFVGVSGACAIMLPKVWARAICVFVALGMTVFAGTHGFKML